MKDIDKNTILRASKADISAFEDIFKAYSPFVYNVALRLTHKEQDAKDIAQEVFLVIHRKLGEFKFRSALKTWVYRITVNQTMNHLKRLRRAKESSFDDQTEQSEKLGAVDSAQTVQNKELVELLLAQLTLEQRVCVVLRGEQGLTYEEIAKALGLDVNVVRSRLKRAREKLSEFKQEVQAYGL